MLSPLKHIRLPFTLPTLIQLRAILRQKRTRKIGSIVMVLLVVLGIVRGCTGAPTTKREEQALPRVTAVEISPGLSRTFRSTGLVEAEKSANFLVNFISSVQDIAVKIGETVEEGQKLLTLKAREVEQDLSTANAYYVSTAQSLQQTRISTQQSVSEAQIALKTAQINLEKLQRENAARTRQAEESLNAVRLNFDLSEASAKTALDNAIRLTQTSVGNALTDADDLLEYSPVQKGLTYVKETHLGVRDPAQKLKTIDALNEAYKSLGRFSPNYVTSVSLLRQTEVAMQMLLIVLHNSVSSPAYSQVTINGNIDAISKHVETLQKIMSDVEAAKRALDSTMQKRGSTSQVLIDAQAQYETTMAGLDAGLRKAELETERARSMLESAIASAKVSEISAYSNLTSAKGTLNQAQISRDKLIITAPFSGVVTDIPVRVGREVQIGEQVLSMEDATWLKIVTYVSSEEVRAIAVGDIVKVGDTKQARIASVSPGADPQSKKYKVELRIGQEVLRSGEFVALTFTLRSNDANDQRIFLPVTAVHVNAAETFVWIAKRNAETGDYVARKQSITIGDLSGKFIEITDGLATGDTVITEGGRAIEREGQEVRIMNNEQ